MVFVKYLVKGVPQTRFLKVVSLLNGKAETIEQKILEICQTCKISLMKVVGFGSDGAAVMVGKMSGVATQLKAHNGELISIHCGAHRLALACSQAAESITYLKRFDGHLISLFYYFKNSPVREAESERKLLRRRETQLTSTSHAQLDVGGSELYHAQLFTEWANAARLSPGRFR